MPGLTIRAAGPDEGRAWAQVHVGAGGLPDDLAEAWLRSSEALARAADRAGRRLAIHVKVDTGMGRVGIRPDQVVAFLDRCRAYPALRLRGLMSHFPCADEADKTFSRDQIECFRRIVERTAGYGIEVRHMANSAAVFDLPDAYFDAVRPGIDVILYPRTSQRLPSSVSFTLEITNPVDSTSMNDPEAGNEP